MDRWVTLHQECNFLGGIEVGVAEHTRSRSFRRMRDVTLSSSGTISGQILRAGVFPLLGSYKSNIMKKLERLWPADHIEDQGKDSRDA